MTGDETSIRVFEVECKETSKEWHSKGTKADRPCKALRQRAERKAMLTAFFDVRGMVLAEFAEPGLMITGESYCQTLDIVKARLKRKRKELWQLQESGWHTLFLHRDNTSSHTSVAALSWFGENNVRMLSHMPYSPDLVPCDFFLFPCLKNCLRGTHF